MKFDLFDALRMLKEHFANEHAEIILSQEDNIIEIRIRVFTNDRIYNSILTITEAELNDNFISIMNIKFYKAIMEVKKLINQG